MRADNEKTKHQPRSLKIQPKWRTNRYYQAKTVPEIKLCGEWLKAIGFEDGMRVTVIVEMGMLVIRRE